MKIMSGLSLLTTETYIKRITSLLLTVLLGVSFIYGESTTSTTTPNVVEQIMIESDSLITIDIPPTILESILKKPAPKVATVKVAKPGVNKTNGYRIQVFSDGRDPSTLESRAKARGKAVLARFPKYRGQIYTTSSAPNWFTRVGNFETSEEANKALSELKSAFPSFAGEMRIVKSPIIIIKK